MKPLLATGPVGQYIDVIRNRRKLSGLVLLPEWRNWQTRWIQNPVPARACGFESHLRYSRKKDELLKQLGLSGRKQGIINRQPAIAVGYVGR